MPKVTRIFPYVNGRQKFTMPAGYGNQVTYHAWAGGGGAGGDSSGREGGNGSAGTYATGQVIINPGDEVEIYVGQGGQEGSAIKGNQKLYSMTLPGRPNSGRGNPAVYGYVNDPTQAVYPIYNDRLTYKTYDRWSSFMNAWAVSNLPNNQSGTEDITCNVYFPQAGSYSITIAGDNKITVYFRDELIQPELLNSFATGKEVTKSISVPEPGVYPVRYVLINNPGSSGNPAGAAIAIYRNALSTFGNGATNAPYSNNLLWTTRFGTNVDVSNRVSIFYAPLVPFYEPAYPVLTGQSESYDWSGFGDKCMAFVNVTTTFTEEDLNKLNLSPSQVIPIAYPVQIKCTGNIDDWFTSGYYTFTPGETWAKARYSWSGNPAGTMLYKTGSSNPSNWTEKFSIRYNGSGRQTNVSGGDWKLDVPANNQIYIIGFSDGLANSNWIGGEPGARGSDNLQWSVTSIQGQTYVGGKGGNSAINLNQLKYFGGYGGQIGTNVTSGGGGGGGGATIILKKSVDTEQTTIMSVAGGGAGGGGAGINLNGGSASNEYIPSASYPNTENAGANGINDANASGGGGGGGGGTKGGAGGGVNQEGSNKSGAPGRTGGSLTTPTVLNMPVASLVMIGRGGDGGDGGGGGGAGELVVTNNLQLRASQFIQVGGSGESRLEGDPSAVWWNDTEFVTAGPGGRGGANGTAFGRYGNGQNGGCVSGDTATRTYGGSGGGGGTNPRIANAGFGLANPSRTVVERKFTSYTNAGGFGYDGAGGGGGGAGGIGSDGRSGIAGKGGVGRSVQLGSTGRYYTLGGGGGGSASPNQRGYLYAGIGDAGSGDGSTGADPGAEFTNNTGQIKTYIFTVPRGVTSITVEAVGAGGSGSGAGAIGGGGGGAGGYLPPTTYPVFSGQKIEIAVGNGGSRAANTSGRSTAIRFFEANKINYTEVLLGGGGTGQDYPEYRENFDVRGGFGGGPNGAQGRPGNHINSGAGADSPLGTGGAGCSVSNTGSRPGNGQGYGSGGGGGAPGREGGNGAPGYARFSWVGAQSNQAEANTGSGGGGGFDGNGGNGGSGFVAIAYAGSPIYKAIVDGREVAPIRQNGYTIHEFTRSGFLTAQLGFPGSSDTGSGTNPGGTNVSGFIPGTAQGGVGDSSTNVFPIIPSTNYATFLNTYGVWNLDLFSPSFERTYNVFFPEYASYEFIAYADNGVVVSVDGGVVLSLTPASRDNGTYWYKNGLSSVHKVQAGLRTVNIIATNLGGQGAFAMTITKQGTSTPLIFNSRQPPISSGSGTGGNGLVIFELEGGEGTAQVKVDNDWKKLIGQWVKVDNQWRKITESAVKVAGIWQSLFGSPPLAITTDSTNWGGPTVPGITPTPAPAPAPAPSPGPKNPPAPRSDWFQWSVSTSCVPAKWGTYMRENAIWKFVDKVTGQAPGGCTIPGGSQTFESSFESDGGNYTVKYAIDDNLTLNLVEQRTGKTIKTISSGNNQGGSATVAAFKIPAGTCLVKGTVSNNANWSIDPAGVVIEIFDSGGGTAWSTSSLL